MTRNMLCALLAVFAAGRSLAGEPASIMRLDTTAAPVRLTGIARVDFFGPMEWRQGPPLQDQAQGGADLPRKSPWLAAGLSLAIPGAGEFYTESYWKSAAFFAVEVAAWAFAYAFDKKGDRQTDFFQNYANAHWSVVQYAEWTQSQVQQAGLDPSSYHLIIPGTSGRPPWEQVDWAELNRMERDFALTSSGSYYSHSLPPYGSQQYFELIGKYEQFSQGWDDANLGLPADYPTIKANLSPEFHYYSIQRGIANTDYTHASTAVAIAIVNHILSAIDGAWTASRFNNSVHARVGVQTIPGNSGIVQVPVMIITCDF